MRIHIRHRLGSPITRLVAGMILLLVSPAAWAYLDPSTGSMVISAIVGIFASIALAVKTYWYKIKGLFRRGENSKTKHAEPNE